MTVISFAADGPLIEAVCERAGEQENIPLIDVTLIEPYPKVLSGLQHIAIGPSVSALMMTTGMRMSRE